ncbi:helix-turn-helix transcriptional regulator [Candidatus Woesearchaeota archaeon]|jgi:transcriptional regulator with XRE-family HTH domain|nr:helix-turn-helix transcriptional regulator [Candidatus Woesearchaeota archaeon]
MGIKDLGIRIKRIRKHLGMSVLDFSTKLDLSSEELEKIEKGKQRPTQEFLRKITRRFSINYYWLTTGEIVSDPIIPDINESWD